MDPVTFLLPLILIAAMYFLMIRPQRKREKEVTAMRNSVKVGDEIVTIGGICAKVIRTKDDRLTIQAGSDKAKFDVMRWAISKVEDNKPAAAVKALKPKEKTDGGAKEPEKKSLPGTTKRMGKKVAKNKPKTSGGAENSSSDKDA
jgi:preprotein translocase subunit YajC